MLLVSCICVGTVTTSAAPSGTTVYFKNTDNWSTVYCYSWVDGGDNDKAWPGTAMTDEGNGIFSYVSTKACDKVIFNNNSGTQTDTMNYPDGEYNYYDCSAKIWVNAAGKEKPFEPTEAIKYYVVGSIAGGWSKNDSNLMTEQDNGTYKVVEHGVLYGTSLSLFVNGDADANLRLDDNNQPMSKVKQYKATSTSLRGLVKLNASVGTYKDMVVCARGYMIIQNKSTGEQSVIYTDVAKGSFNNPIQ